MKKKMMKKVVSFALALMMVLTSVLVGGVEVKAADTYGITVSADKTSIEVGGTITLTAAVTKNGEAVTDLAAAGLTVGFYHNTSSGNQDATYTNSASTSLTGEVKLNSEGEYYFTAELYDGSWNSLGKAYITLTGTEATGNQDPVYTIAVSADKTSVEVGETITLTAAVTKDSEVVTDLETEGLKVGFYHNTSSGNQDATYTNSASTSLTGEVKLNSEGEYYFTAELYASDWTSLGKAYITLTGTEATGDQNPAPTNPIYTITVTANETSVEVGETITLTAAVKKDDVAVTDLAAAGLTVSFYHDWSNGVQDATYNNQASTSLTGDIKLNSVGEHYFTAELYDESWNSLGKAYITLTATAASGTTNPDDENTTDTKDENTTTPEPETEPEEEKVVVFDVPLQNADFEKDIENADSIWSGYLESGKNDWGANSFDELNYAEDEPTLEKPASHGAQCLKFVVEPGEGLIVRQWVEKLPAGTYTITAPVMGGDAKVSFILGEYGETPMESKATTLSGWNVWDTAKATFVVEEDMYNVQIGFKFIATGTANGWGFVDNLEMQGGVPKTGDTTNIYAYVVLMMAGLAIVGYSVKRNKVEF